MRKIIFIAFILLSVCAQSQTKRAYSKKVTGEIPVHIWQGIEVQLPNSSDTILTASLDSIFIGDGVNIYKVPPYLVNSKIRIDKYIPGSGTAIVSLGPAVTALATVSTPTITGGGTLITGYERWLHTSAATTNAVTGVRVAQAALNGGTTGGYRVTQRFWLNALQAGNRACVCLSSGTGAPTNIDPLTSTTNSTIGLAINTNTGNWQLIRNIAGTAPTVVDLGATFPVNTTDVLELVITRKRNSTEVLYSVTILNSGAKTSGTLTTNIPAANTAMTFNSWITNNATAAAVGIGFMYITVEKIL